jgi:hypothetical protein
MGRRYSQTITLPNMECSNCTLQVIQLMTDKPPYTTDAASDDIYFQCADFVLTNSAPQPDAGPDPGSGQSGSCDAGGGGSFALVGFVLALPRRRRRLK